MAIPSFGLTRRRFLGLAAAGLAGGFGYMRYGEPGWLDIGRHAVPLPGDKAGPRPLTLLHLSDLHASKFVSLATIEHAIQIALASCQPDLICLTGDFITSKWEDWEGYARVLSQLPVVAPTYATVGNHDGGKWAGRTYGYSTHDLVDEMLAHAGLQHLHNRRVAFDHDGWALNIVGVGDLWSDEIEVAAWQVADPKRATVLLSHNPDSKDKLAEQPWDLMLSGHTHGGQLRIPFVGTPFAPVRDHRFVQGLHRWENHWLHITKGIGNLHGMRLNCRPEISVLTLLAA